MLDIEQLRPGDMTHNQDQKLVEVVEVGEWFVLCRFVNSEGGIAIPTRKNTEYNPRKKEEKE